MERDPEKQVREDFLGKGSPGSAYLEDADEGLRKVVKVAAPLFQVLKVIAASKELHAQQGKDDDEEKEQ